MSTKWLAVLFLLVCIFNTSAGQEIPMLHYSADDGLPSNTVYGICRDSKGFLWFATDKGVTKYNGLRFENYTTFDGLSDNEVFGFCEDKLGRLWLKTFNGELCFYKNGKFHNASNTAYLKLPVRQPYVWFIQDQYDGSVNIAFHNRPMFINIDSNSMRVYDLKEMVISDTVEFIFYISGTRLTGYHVTTSHKTIEIDTANKIRSIRNHAPYRFKTVFGTSTPYFHATDGIYTIDKKMVLSFSESRNLKNYGYKNNVANPYIHGVARDSNFFFVCTNDGLWINDSLQILPGTPVSSIAQDVEGNYWLSTTGNGTYKLCADLSAISRQGNMARDRVLYAHSYGDIIHFTSGRQLYRLKNGKATSILSYPEGKGRNIQSRYPLCAVGDDNNCYSFFSGNILVKNLTKQKPVTIIEVTSPFQWKSLLLGPNKLYGVGLGKIFYLNRDTLNATLRPPVFEVEGHDLRMRIFGTAVDKDGFLWYSTINRVYKTGGDSPVLQKQFNTLAFKWMKICDNYLVGATHGQQLVVCNNFNKNLEVDTIKGQNCIWIEPFRLSDKYLLVATNNLYRLITLSPSAGKPEYSVTTIENQFLPREAEYVCSDGVTAHFFKNGAMYSIAIEKLLKVNNPPRLLFTSLKTGSLAIDIDEEKPVVSIPFNEAKNIVVIFESLSFNSNVVSCEYSVAPDNTWIPVKGGEIHLVSPDYGDYVLKVRTRSFSSGFSKPITMQLTIMKPFWAETWFQLLCAVSLLGILAGGTKLVIRRRLSNKEKKHASEIRFLKSEYKALNALMNPHFIFNSLNSIQGLVNEDDKEGANKYLQYFSELVRQNMHNITKELIPLQKEMDLVANYLKLEQLRFHGWLNYEIEIDEEVETELIMIPPLLIQPFVENAIKHGLLPRQSADNKLLI
ncbi:MAG: histidine kinase, partial [Taibaiella sp.]|nr:histidine kinase [Taibaiella sp.]